MKVMRLIYVSFMTLLCIPPVLAAPTDKVEQGKQIFNYWCGSCHSPGPGNPGTTALKVKYQGTLPAALAERTDLTPALIATYVRNGMFVMPFFRKTEISDADLDLISIYLGRNSNIER